MKASRSVRNFMLITSLTSVWALILGTVALTSVAAEEKDPGQMLTETSEVVSFAETSSGELARKLAGKMINKYPSLKQNPMRYWLSSQIMHPKRMSRIFSTKLMDQLLSTIR